jgi:hypothetical protein
MLKTSISMLALLMLCSGCATVPSACPAPPPPPAKVPLGPSFQDQMESFLKGSLPEPINYALPLENAKGGLKR